MHDREKIINGLREMSCRATWEDIDRIRNKFQPIINGAIDLLKEQEAVAPIKMQRMDNNFSFFVPYFLCGNCRYELEGKDVMFCAHCGRPVKWDD